MGRNPCCCCSNIGLHKRRWTAEEDQVLSKYVAANGGGNWRSVPQRTGIQRCGRSCRFRWMNYLRPDIKRGNIEPDEEDLIIRLHAQLGNKWSRIAKHLPGRSDNEIKNYWNNHLRKKLEHQKTDHNANNPQPLEKNKKNHIKNKSEMKEKAHRPKAIRWMSSQKYTWNCDNLGAMGVCGGLDDKLVIESSSHDGRNELVKDGLDVSQPAFYSSIFEDHGLDFLDEGMLEELSEFLKEDAWKQVQLDPFAESV